MPRPSRRDVEQPGPLPLPVVANGARLGHPAVSGAILDEVEDDMVELSTLEAVRGARISHSLLLC